MKPLISVIIPAHNSAQTIGVAIDSILKQTYPNIEIIVVDDNSTDNTNEVVRIYEKKGRVFYFKLPFNDPHRVNKRGRNINAGYSARNYGFEKIQGEWVTFQDADDASLLNRIEVQYDLALKYKAAHLCVDWQQFNPAYLNKKLDVEVILKEQTNIIIGPDDLSARARRSKGLIPKIFGPLHQFIPFELKRARFFNKFFFGTLESYPGTGNSPLFQREVLEKVRFRKLSKRVWPSFTGRGADRDFNFQVAETFNNSFVFKLPLYLWQAPNQNVDYKSYGKYIL